MIDLNQLRTEINDVDTKLVSLLKKRMEISKKIGKYKKENNLEIFDANREKEVINNFLSLSKEDEQIYIEKFLKNLMEMSKEIQKKLK